MVRKGGSGLSLRHGIMPQHLCCGCIAFLSTLLVLQVGVLTSLLRRLAEIQRLSASAGEEGGGGHAAGAMSGSAPVLRAAWASLGSVHLGSSLAAPGPVLALGYAVSADPERVLIFLQTLFYKTPVCEVRLIVAAPPLSEADLRLHGVDPTRVAFETTGDPPADLIPGLHEHSIRLFYLKRTFERLQAWKAYRFVQLSYVADIAFQEDPFKWVAQQPPGLQGFAGQPRVPVHDEPAVSSSLTSCYGDSIAQELQLESLLVSDYVIGDAAAVRDYLDRMVQELLRLRQCQQSLQPVKAVHNYLLHRNSGQVFGGHLPHLSGEGVLWTGSHASPAAILQDNDGHVLDDNGRRYMVLHLYHRHGAVMSRLKDGRPLHAPQAPPLGHAPGAPEASTGCAAFNIQPGDIRGFDLSHKPVVHRDQCCNECRFNPQCRAFVYGAEVGHCWLKAAGVTLNDKVEKLGTEAGFAQAFGNSANTIYN